MEQVIIPHVKSSENIVVDVSIAPLIKMLNEVDFIWTLFCCAGHNKEQFYITFKYNLDTFILLNKVFDNVQEKYKGPIHLVIDVNTLQDGQKCVTIRSRTQQGFYCKLSEYDKMDFCTNVVQGFSYWLYALKHNPKLYNCRIG